MSAFSKYFALATVGKKCSDFTHPGITCEHFAFTTFRDGILGGLQYYLPSIIVPALIKWDRWSKDFWIKILKDYCSSIFFGACMMIFVGFGSFCIIYKFIVQHYRIFVFFPCFLGSIFCYFMPSHILEIQTIGAVNMCLDYGVRSSRFSVVQKCRKSVIMLTLMFMGCSAAISKFLKKGIIRRYWFLSVPPVVQREFNQMEQEKDQSVLMNKVLKTERKICQHLGTCDRFIGEEVKRTAIFSFLVGFAKFLVSESKKLQQDCGRFPQLFIKRFDYGFFFFLTFYSGLYRFSNCLLNRYTDEDSEQNSVYSAFISGISFCLYPKFLILSFGLVRTVQMVWLNFVEQHKDKSEKLRRLSNFPFSWAIYSVATAFAYQCRVFYPYVTPKYVHQIMNIGTGRRSDTLTRCYSAIMMGLK